MVVLVKATPQKKVELDAPRGALRVPVEDEDAVTQ
jgi:hypothetical protein